MNPSPEALADLNRAIEQKPDNSWALAHRGEVYRGLRQYDLALADLNRALELKPDYAWALAHRGATYRFMGRPYYDRALADLNLALALQPDYAWALAYRGLVYELMERYEEALADFDRAITLDDRLFGPYWRGERGLLLSYGGRRDEAMASFRQALQVHPGDFFALYGIAVIKANRQGPAPAQAEINAARTAIQARLERGAQQEELLYWLSVLALLEGHRDQAWAYLQEAISLGGEEVIAFAGRDPAGRIWRNDPHFLALTGHHKY